MLFQERSDVNLLAKMASGWRKVSSKLIVSLIATILLTNCGQDDKLNARLRDDVSRAEQAARKATAQLTKDLAAERLKELRAANARSLSSPRLIYAILFETNDKYLLSVRWIEKRPSVESIRFRSRKDGTWSVFPVPEVDQKNNRETNLPQSVEFDAVLEWTKGPGSSPGFSDMKAPKGSLEVQLVSDGGNLSNTVFSHFQDNRGASGVPARGEGEKP